MRKLARGESGQALVVFAAFLSILAIGFLAFAVDVGTLFRQKRQAQAAADAAAIAAAEEVSAGYSANQQTVANSIAKLNGFDTTLASNPATVTLSTPATGTFSGTGYVQATVSRPISTFFLGAFMRSRSTVAVSASAVAGGSSTSRTCVCLEGGSGQVLNLSNGSRLNASGCGIVDNSNGSNALGVTGGSTLNALTLGTVSTTWDNGSNINNGGSITPGTTIIQGITSTCSPTLPTAPSYSNCTADPGGSYGTFSWGPASSSGVVCYNGLTVGANGSNCTLKPGTYVINGGNLHFESGTGGYSNYGGNGVFFYLINNATLLIDNGANVNLVAGGANQSNGTAAPSLGSYDGIVVYQASGDATSVSLQGGSSTYINGAVYAPSASINVGNGSGATFNGGILANALNLTGGATLNAVTDTNEGSLSTGAAKLVQ